MEDTTADPLRRDEMARAAAVYCHPRLSAITTSNTNYKGDSGDIGIVSIVAIPRGGRLDPKTGTIMIDGEVLTEPPTVSPYEGTPGLSAITDQSKTSAPLAEPLEVIEVADDPKITRLNPFRRRDEPPDDTV